MTGSAWIMLIATWGVVGFFTAYFLLKVLKKDKS